MSDFYQRTDVTDVGFNQQLNDVLNAESRCCPRRTRCVGEFWNATIEQPISPRSAALAYHGGITLSARRCSALRCGTLLGIGLAVVIVHNEAIGPLADAVDHRQPDHADPRDCTDGGGGAERRRG